MTNIKHNIGTKITLQTPIMICSSDGFFLDNTNIFLNISDGIFVVVLAGVLIKLAI